MTESLIDRGLDLSHPDSMAPGEYDEFKDYYSKVKGYPLPAFDLWAENRPDVLKRYRLQARMMVTEEGRRYPMLSPMSHLHYYAIVGYEDGILYEVRSVQARGASKAEVLATLAVAFLHAGPRGMRYVATSSQDYLRTYEDPTPAAVWPSNWDIDPGAFRSGLDFSVPELLPGESDLLEAWYMQVCGEVPSYVPFLARHRPGVLKAYRNRFEHAIGDGMPKQMMAYLQLHWNTVRGFAPGVREAVCMGRGFGMTSEQLFDAIAGGGLIYGGPAATSLVYDAAGDILDSM